jgi:hypothetical protein
MPTYPNNINLTDRDVQILHFIYLLNGCSIDHIAARFFDGSLKSCYRRVGQLKAAGLIGWQRPGSSTGVGSGKALLTLPAKGRELLAVEYLHVPTSAVGPVKQVSTTYARDHHLALCDFWLSLELAVGEASTSHQSIYLEWVSEKVLRSNPIRVTTSRRPAPRLRRFIPDGDFTIRLAADRKQAFKLEMEMDPLRRPQIIKDKLAGYFDHLSALARDCATSSESGPPDIPFILWVVPDARAQSVMAAWTLELAQRFGDDPSFVWIATRAAIASRSILSPIWKVAGVEMPQSLIPTANFEAASPPLRPTTYPTRAYEIGTSRPTI